MKCVHVNCQTMIWVISGKKFKPTKKLTFFSELQLKMLLLDLFFAGSETTVTTTKWGILMMVLHPEIQKRVQEELDQCPPKIQVSDRNKLTYLQATINVNYTHLL